MKKLAALIATAAFTSSFAAADVSFDPAFTGDTVPAGYTEVDKAGGSVTYSPGNMVSSDFSVSGSEAYITATSTSGSESLTTDLTFTPNYTADTADFGYPHSGTDAGAAILDIFPTSDSNRPILEIDFNANAFNNNASVDVSGDTNFGNHSTQTGVSEFASTGPNSLSGVALTVNLTTTLTNLGADPSTPGNLLWQITDVGTISDGTTSTPIDTTIVGSTNSSYDPIDSPLKIEAGNTAGTYGGGANGGADGYLSPGATLDFSDVSVETTTPEPSTVALMLGGLGLMVLMVRRRMSA